MSTKWVRISAALVFLVATGCKAPDYAAKDLDLSKLKPNEGLFVTRVITSIEYEDDKEAKQVKDADVDCTVHYGTSKSRMVNNFLGSWFFGSTTDRVTVSAGTKCELVVRKREAGDYYWNRLYTYDSYKNAYFAGKFSVVPGKLTYIGDLNVKLHEQKGWFGTKSHRSGTVSVGMDPAAIRAALGEKFGTVPSLRIDPMVFESTSF